MKHYTTRNYRTDDSLGHLIAQAHLAMRARLDVEVADYDLTAAQWIVLMKLHRGQHRNAAELAWGLNQDAGSMTRMLDRLEAKGLLRRVRSKTDRRVVELELTDEGRALAPSLSLPIVNVLNEALQDFSKEEVATLSLLLRRVTEALKSAPANQEAAT
jgi:DNA-binding MarR family transcriptional regulator